jgi:hypothetical protein
VLLEVFIIDFEKKRIAEGIENIEDQLKNIYKLMNVNINNFDSLIIKAMDFEMFNACLVDAVNIYNIIDNFVFTYEKMVTNKSTCFNKSVHSNILSSENNFNVGECTNSLTLSEMLTTFQMSINNEKLYATTDVTYWKTFLTTMNPVTSSSSTSKQYIKQDINT